MFDDLNDGYDDSVGASIGLGSVAGATAGVNCDENDCEDYDVAPDSELVVGQCDDEYDDVPVFDDFVFYANDSPHK